MEKGLENFDKKRKEGAIKEFLVWAIGVATLAIMSRQLVGIFFGTRLGSFIEDVSPNILFILFGLSLYWCIQMLRGKHGAWRKPFFILSVVIGTLYFASGVRFVEKYIWLAKGVFGASYSFIASLLFIGSLLLMATPYTIFLIRRLVNLFKKKANSAALSMEGLFKYDRFDSKNDKPHVGRTQMIDTIVEQVKLLQHSKSSFTIGIEGGWGSGKTTLLEGIKERLRNKTDEYGNHIEVVEFSPWAYPDGKNLSVEFLYELKSVLTKYSLRARFVVNTYINALAENTNFIQAITRLLFPHESLQKVKKKLSELILLHRIKLVVVIDDLDRLDEDEIAEVFRLLRNTGDLPNMVYLVAYDRLHIETLGHNSGMGDSKGRFGDGYLDKVINVELDMNSYNRDLLLGELISEANEMIKREYIPLDIDVFQGFDSLSYVHQGLLRVVETKRDKLRILNSLSYRLRIISSNHSKTNAPFFIHPQFILFMELVKNTNPFVYDSIMNRKVFDNNLLLKMEEKDAPILLAFGDVLKEHAIIYPDGKNLNINPMIVIDDFFAQSENETNILYRLRGRIINSTNDIYDFDLSELIRRSENPLQARLLVQNELIIFLNKWDWTLIQTKALIHMFMDVIDESDTFKTLLPSIKKFACNIQKNWNESLHDRPLIIETIMKYSHTYRIKPKHHDYFNTYDECFCEVYKLLDTNERELDMLSKQEIRIDRLLINNKFSDALIQLPFFIRGEGSPPEILTNKFKSYLEMPEKILAVFYNKLLINMGDVILIGNKYFPIKSLYPLIDNFAKLLINVNPEYDNGSLYYLGHYLNNNAGRIILDVDCFKLTRDESFETLLKRVPSINGLFQRINPPK